MALPHLSHLSCAVTEKLAGVLIHQIVFTVAHSGTKMAGPVIGNNPTGVAAVPWLSNVVVLSGSEGADLLAGSFQRRGAGLVERKSREERRNHRVSTHRRSTERMEESVIYSRIPPTPETHSTGTIITITTTRGVCEKGEELCQIGVLETTNCGAISIFSVMRIWKSQTIVINWCRGCEETQKETEVIVGGTKSEEDVFLRIKEK